MFAAAVERWRASARKWAAWAVELFHSQLDESDVLALISLESGGDPSIVSKTGYRGLGQIGAAALADYNAGIQDSLTVDYSWLIDPDHADDQIRVIAWHMARGRTIVSGWAMPDARGNSARWADVRYSWGGGNLRAARARYVDAYGAEPTFAALSMFEPDAGGGNVRPWRHANELVSRAASDRGSPVVDVDSSEKKKR